MKTADEILAMTKPEQLFSGVIATLKDEYRELVKRWHPDKPGGHTGVFQTVEDLYNQAVDKLEDGNWETPGLFRVGDLHLSYRKMHDFELGKMLISDSNVTFVIEPEHVELVANGLAMTKSFKYSCDAMKQEISRYLPDHVKKCDSKISGGKLCIKIPKTTDQLLLRDVINHYGGKIPPVHAAWIQSTMHNLACYFRWARIAHNDISPDTYFISPKFHSGALLGGWWYARISGELLKHVNMRTLGLLPSQVKISKVASRKTDLELIRATGREVLGDLNGVHLHADTPKPMAAWVNALSSGDAFEDYAQWKPGVLEKSFGKPKFHEMTLTAEELYKK